MAGEFNATNVIIRKNGSNIVGQMEFTVTHAGTPIDISNKSYQDFVTLLDGELAGKQLTFAGTIVYNNDSVFSQMRADSFTGTQDTYDMIYPDGKGFTGTFVPNGLSEAIPHGDKTSTTINLLSSGQFTIL